MSFKAKIKVMLCKHRKTEPCIETGNDSPFSNIQGKTVYYRCEKCGKIVSEEFLTWEQQMYRFGRYL